MNKCPDCGAGMTALFSSLVCPNECDLPPEKRTAKPKTITVGKSIADQVADLYKKAYSNPAAWVIPTAPANPFGGWGFPTYANHQGSAPATYTPAPDQCPDGYCRAKGQKMFSSYNMQQNSTWLDHYECTLCKKEWDAPGNPPTSQVSNP